MVNSELKLIKKTSVWIVDDHHDFRNTIADLINSQTGMYCSALFGSCERMIENIPQLSPPDVVLMDLKFPSRMSGIEGIKYLHETIPHVYILILSNYIDEDLIIDALRSGACGYSYKMGSPEQIVHSIKELAEKGATTISPQIAGRILKLFEAQVPPAGLSVAETRILEHTERGTLLRELPERLRLNSMTIAVHIQNIYRKLHAL